MVYKGRCVTAESYISHFSHSSSPPPPICVYDFQYIGNWRVQRVQKGFKCKNSRVTGIRAQFLQWKLTKITSIYLYRDKILVLFFLLIYMVMLNQKAVPVIAISVSESRK